MSFCAACGNEVGDAAVVCISCGVSVNNKEMVEKVEPLTGKQMGLYILCGILFPIAGLIIGGYQMTKEPRRSQGMMIFAASVGFMWFWKIVLS